MMQLKKNMKKFLSHSTQSNFKTVFVLFSVLYWYLVKQLEYIYIAHHYSQDTVNETFLDHQRTFHLTKVSGC